MFGYVKVNFGAIATIVRGASPRPIKNYITENCNGVNWIKIGDIKPNTKYVTATAEKLQKKVLRNQDVFIQETLFSQIQ